MSSESDFDNETEYNMEEMVAKYPDFVNGELTGDELEEFELYFADNLNVFVSSVMEYENFDDFRLLTLNVLENGDEYDDILTDIVEAFPVTKTPEFRREVQEYIIAIGVLPIEIANSLLNDDEALAEEFMMRDLFYDYSDDIRHPMKLEMTPDLDYVQSFQTELQRELQSKTRALLSRSSRLPTEMIVSILETEGYSARDILRVIKSLKDDSE